MVNILPKRNTGACAVWLALAGLIVGVNARPGAAQNAGYLAAAIDSMARVTPNESQVLRRVYGTVAYRPLWISDGRATVQAIAALAFIDSVAQRGLRAEDYDVDELHALRELSGASDGLPASDSMRSVTMDMAMTRAVIHLLVDLERGRVDPSRVGFEMPSREPRDVSSVVLATSRAADVPGTLEAVEPRYAGYAALIRMLARYRALARDTSLKPPSAEATIRPNDIYPDAPRLRRFLIALGDLSPTAAFTENDRYAGALVLAVMHFQRRHGLVPDGTIGEATRAMLHVPIAERVAQIELALERWRWLPPRPPARYVVINIPAFRLYAFENDSLAQRPLLSMNVIVGEAERRRDTPVFVSEMREVVFRPYWDVPPRIARTELVPAIERGRIDMESEGYEIVAPGNSSRVYPPTRANLDRVAAGTLLLRQRPGSGNALGLVKFVFPNSHNVYLHGTPAEQLFAFARRDFSHGCIRAAQPASLACFVLAGDSAWNPAAVETAMHGDRTVHVPLPQPVTVFILYMTTVAGPDGTLYFYPDLYGEDEELERALLSAPNKWN